MPGETRPRSIRALNGTRGASRAVMKDASAGSGIGSTAAIRSRAAAAYSELRSMPMKRRRSRRATAPVVPVPENGSSTRSSGRDAARMTRAKQRLRLLRRMQLLAVAAFEPFLAGAQRNEPIGAHLDVVIARFERLVIERIIVLGGVARGPDQGFVRIGEAAAAEIRHRVGFAPDDVVEDPEAEILEDRADAENVVIGADDPQAWRSASSPGGRR